MKPFSVALALLLPVVLTGCVAQTQLDEKRYNLCRHLETLDNALATARRVIDVSATTVANVRQAQVQIETAFNSVKGAIQDIPPETQSEDVKKTYQEVESTYGELDKTVDELSTPLTLEQKKAMLRQHIATTQTASTKLQIGLSCRRVTRSFFTR